MIKQVIVVRKDLNMRKGKMVAQGAHASMKVILDRAQKDEYSIKIMLQDPALREWLNGTFTKVVVSVDSEDELMELYHKAQDMGLPAAYIIDSGFTEFHSVPTLTCAAFGPSESELLDKVTGHLKLL